MSVQLVPEPLRPAVEHYFGARLRLAARYAELLVSDGVGRGLIGPREVERLWDRHLLNSVAVVERIPLRVRVADVGSGAGLPGLAVAIARDDLFVTLIDSQLRRTGFLDEVVSALRLDNVTVVRARAEDAVPLVGTVDVVLSRAVAPLDRLAAWCLPLADVGGKLVAIKGASAADEVAQHRAAVRRAGGTEPAVLTCGSDWLDPPVTVVEVVRERGSEHRRETPARQRGRRPRPERRA